MCGVVQSWYRVFLLLFCLVCFFRLDAQQAPYAIDKYDVDVIIRQDGSAQISEEIHCFFSEMRRGIIREIPLISEAYDVKKRIKISDVQVASHSFKKSANSKFLSLKIGDPKTRITGKQVYKIKYTIDDIRHWTGKGYVFYHNLIGTGWSADIKSGLLQVYLPEDLHIDRNTIAVFSGSRESEQSFFSHQFEKNSISVKIDRMLRPGQGVTLGFNYPDAYYSPPPPPDPWYVHQKWAAIPLTMLIILCGFWLKMGCRRIEKTERISSIPPQEYNASEIGAFIDSKAQYRDLLALIPDWGRMGYLRMQHGEEDTFLVKLNDYPEHINDYRSTFFSGIFQSKDLVSLADLRSNLWKHTAQAQKQLKDFMLDQNLYNKRSYFVFHSGFTIACVLLLMGGIVLSVILGQFIAAGICFFLVVLLLIQFNRIPALTEKGSDLMNQALQYKNYIEALIKGDEYGEIVIDDLLPYMIVYDIDVDLIPSGISTALAGPSWYVDDRGQMTNYQEYRRGWKKAKMKSVIASSGFSAESTSLSSGRSFSGGSRGGRVGGGSGGGGGRSW